jgi:tRNA(Ile)-lysidine synthase
MELISLEKYRNLRVCVAVSGGIDSICLLHVFARSAAEFQITLSAVTCEHGIRGGESERDLNFVQSVCADWKIPLRVFSADIPARAKEHGKGLEEEGRAFRYECFAKILQSDADAVATAHHRDDFAETVLFRLVRGTSLAGLGCIAERNGIVRPFLNVSRAEIEAYAQAHSLPYVNDSTNADEQYARNAIRHSVFPVLENLVGGAGERLVRFALRAKQDDDFLQTLAREKISERDGDFYVSVNLPQPLFSRACIDALKRLGVEKNYSDANAEEIEKLKGLQSGRKVCLPCGFEAAREGDVIVLYRPVRPFEGEIPFGRGNFRLSCYEAEITESGEDGLRADFGAFPEGCVLRTRREGDRITPFHGKEKPLKAFLTDRKIPARIGRALPLIAKGSEVYAVFGVEISDFVKVTDKTSLVVRLRMKRNG